MLTQDKIPIYIVHHKPNMNRLEFIEEQFSKQNLYYELIEEFSPETILKPECDTITIREYSLYLKFEKALKKFVSTGNEYCIIFEDDILLCDNFSQYFNMFFQEFLKIDGDLLVIGTAFNEQPSQIFENTHVYYEPRFRTRCAHAILYSKRAAKTVLEELHIDTYRGYDHKLNDIIDKRKLKTCWLEPGLNQTSIGGVPHFKFPTSIR